MQIVQSKQMFFLYLCSLYTYLKQLEPSINMGLLLCGSVEQAKNKVTTGPGPTSDVIAPIRGQVADESVKCVILQLSGST